MRILFVSSSPIKKELSIGNTFLNLFEDNKNVEMASVFTRAGRPDEKIQKSFCITEKMLINNLLKGTPVGKEVVFEGEKSEVIPNNTKEHKFAKKYRLTVFFWLQNLIWSLGRWKSPELEKFIKEYNPDIIFTILSNTVFLNKLIMHIKKVSNKKLVLYAWDNNYSLKRFMLSPLRWIKMFIDRSYMRKVVKQAELLYVISDVQKEDYQKAFKKECKVLTKGADFSGEAPIKTEYGSPLQFAYTGNIELNRWKSLAHIANVLEKINANGVKAQLRIYTGNTVTEKMSKALNKGDSSFIMGSVSAEKVKEIQNNADCLVHIESLDLKNKLYVRQSFSTKIVDYLAAARPILAFGPKDVASVDHFVKNDCAIVADSEEELYNKLCSVIDDESKLKELSIKAFVCGKKHHNKADIDNMLKEDLWKVVEG